MSTKDVLLLFISVKKVEQRGVTMKDGTARRWTVDRRTRCLCNTLWTDGITNVSELLQVFKLMTIMFHSLLIILTEGIANITNRLDWYLGELCFNYCSHLIDYWRVCAIKINGKIKCRNCNYWAPQNPPVTAEQHGNLLEVAVWCGESVLSVISSH